MNTKKEQERTIEIFGEKIKYILRISKRARRVRLVIYGNGHLVAVRPRGVTDSLVEEFIIKKAKWIIKKQKECEKLRISPPQNGYKDYLKYKNKALEFIKSRINELNKIYNFKVNKIKVKNQKTRWGSCSAKGNLNFNYKILFLAKHLADYIIVHELCHLKELNHSPRFWALVAKAVPNYNQVRKELRQKGLEYY